MTQTSDPDNPAAPAKTSPWAPLRRPTYRMLWLAALASNVGTWMQDVGAGWLMTLLTSSPLMVALVQSAMTLPMVFLALPAGALADIVDRRKYLIWVTAGSSAVAAALAALTYAGWVDEWTLLGFTFLLGAGMAMTMPAWAANTPELVPREELQSAIAINAMGMNVSRALGPAIAGVIISFAGSAAVFALNAVSFAVVIIAVLRWRRDVIPQSLPAERLGSAMRTGMRFARNAPTFQAIMLRGACFFVFGSVVWALLPLIARERLGGGPESYGLLVTAVGAGAVGGAVLLPKVKEYLDSDRMVMAATGLFAGAAVVMGLADNLYIALPAMIAFGASWIAAMSSLQTAAQLALPNWVRARGLSVFIVVLMACLAGGSAIWGQVAEFTDITTPLFLSAGLGLVAIPLTRRFRLGNVERLDHAPSTHWPEPVLDFEPDADKGPVLTMIEYEIDPGDVADFKKMMRRMRQFRLRDGAFSWSLYQDVSNSRIFIEAFRDLSWVEHLRHHQRVTRMGERIQEEAAAFHKGDGPPKVRHMVPPGSD